MSRKNYVEEEYRRLKQPSRQYLVLHEVMRFRSITLPVDIKHLGVLWMLDSNRDGRVTLDELCALQTWAKQTGAPFQSFEESAQLHALCSIKLWQDVSREHGRADFCNWIAALLLENSNDRRRFWRYGAHQYIHVDTVGTLHQFLQIHDVLGLSLQAFVDLLQRVAEEQRLMDLNDEDQDEWVPLSVLKEFAANTYVGAVKLIADIGLPEGLTGRQQ